jgi:hypothetical protein
VVQAVPGFREWCGGIFPTAVICSRRTLRQAATLTSARVVAITARGEHIVIETPASNLSARVHALIARHHAGDCRAAAEQLGLEPATLAGLLTSDWRQFSLSALAVIVRAYDVSPAWLLAASVGADAPSTRGSADAIALFSARAPQPAS